MCHYCRARRRLVVDLEQALSSFRPDASAAIQQIDEASDHDNNAGQPFKTRFGLIKAHFLLGLQEPLPSPSLIASSLLSCSCYDNERQTLDMSLSTRSMTRYVSRDLRLKSLPAWISELDLPLKVIDLSGNPSLSRLPVNELCDMKNLKEIRCERCIALSLPPPEVADQGGEAVVKYLQRVREDGEENKRMSLILIGSGEAGKTSILQALMSQHDKADKIDVEEGRTVGIDLHDWHPQGEEGLTFDVMDFGGQAVYGKTNQYFIVRRALYLLVWSVRKGEESGKEAGGEGDELQELKAMTSYWLRAIHARVPGASVMLVATHIDLAASGEALKQQCEEVRRCVEEELKLMSEDEDGMILPLHVLNQGESFQVNCLTGKGIAELRQSVCGAAKKLLWWKERVPRAFLRLKEAVMQRSRAEAVIDKGEYMALVEEAKVDREEARIATTMLHEMGVLKYFGHKLTDDKIDDMAYDKSDNNNLSLRCVAGMFGCLGRLSLFSRCSHTSRPNRIQDEDQADTPDSSTGAGRDPSKQEQEDYSFEDSVFISPAWMIEVFKGVMRHDWQHLLESSSSDRMRAKKVKKLLQLGIVDEDMLQDLWPRQSSEEPQKSAAHKLVEPSKAVALLRGCDLAHFLGAGGNAEAAARQQTRTRELLCPGIIPHFMHQHQRAVGSSDALCARTKYEYNIFPAGFTDRLVVRCAGRHEDVDCSAGMAVMRGWGRMLVVSWSSEDLSKHTLRVDASTREQLENFEADVKALEAFFPGMKRRKRQERLVGDEKVQVGVFWCGNESASCAREIKQAVESIYKSHSPPLSLSCQIFNSSDYVSEDNICLVNIVCISKECLQGDAVAKLFLELWNKLTASRAIIVPVILEDYMKIIIDNKKFARWWPETITGMEKYRIFHEYKSDEASMRRMYQDVMTKLRQGQASLQDSLSVSSQNKLLCEDCMRDVNKFVEVGEYDLSETNLQDEHSLTQQVTCSNKAHRKAVEEVIEFNNSFAPCPYCPNRSKPAQAEEEEAASQQPRLPHFFSRPACLSKLDRDLTAKEYCPSCQRDVDVIDVVPPQVFLSYNWGVKVGTRYSTQEMVRQVKQKIEERTSLQCWFDVEGGISVGDDHMVKMEIGVGRCEVLVMFVSDKYVKSANCRREYQHACQSRKYIIPVFVPVLFDRPDEKESGWQGNKHEGWWKSIPKSDNHDEKSKVDWSHLASFPKTFDLLAQLDRDQDVITVKAVDDLVEAVQARAYKGDVVVHEVMWLACLDLSSDASGV